MSKQNKKLIAEIQNGLKQVDEVSIDKTSDEQGGDKGVRLTEKFKADRNAVAGAIETSIVAA